MTGFMWPLQMDYGDPSKYSLISHVRHKTNASVYGTVSSTSTGMVFSQWKWPKSLPPRKDNDPPRTTSVKITHKPVDASIWNSFERITLQEFCEIETVDMANSSNQ